MKEVIIIAKCLVLLVVLGSCSAGHQYITIVNRSVKPIEVVYTLVETKQGILYAEPKLADADTNKLDSKKFEQINDLNTLKYEVKVLLPSGKVLIIGSFDKTDLAGDPEQMKFKGGRYNLTGIKVASEGGEVEKDHDDSKSIFQYDKDGNYRVLILD